MRWTTLLVLGGAWAACAQAREFDWVYVDSLAGDGNPGMAQSSLALTPGGGPVRAWIGERLFRGGSPRRLPELPQRYARLLRGLFAPQRRLGRRWESSPQLRRPASRA